MRWRLLLALPLLLAPGACASDWESRPPTSLPGGTGVNAQGEVLEGPDATASITRQPASNRTGAVPPFGTQGEAAAYEYKSGYRVGAGDRLTIRVLGQVDLTGEYPVDGAGNISMPLIHTQRVAGQTTPEIEGKLVNALQNGFLRNPSVSVQVSTQRPFYILGEVVLAGSYPYQPGMTVQNALAIAGGYTARANQGAVLVTRRSNTGTRTDRVPVTAQLYPGDIVYVRERWF